MKIERFLPGPIERIWVYLTEGDLRRQWLAAGEMEMKVGAPYSAYSRGVDGLWGMYQWLDRGPTRAATRRASGGAATTSTARAVV